MYVIYELKILNVNYEYKFLLYMKKIIMVFFRKE